MTPLGEKIREKRLEKGLTQDELAGEKITRNMLSMIERGITSPSVGTLVYLAERLGVPAGYFIPSDDEEEKNLARLVFVDRMRSAYGRHDWKECVSLACGTDDSEIAYILACAYLELAYSEGIGQFDVGTASLLLDKAEEAGKKSVYCGESFLRTVEYYRLMLENLAEDEIPDGLCDLRGCGEHLSPDIPAYFIELKCLRSGDGSPLGYPHNGHRAEHLSALEESLDGNYTDAIRKLTRLSNDDALPSYMLFRVLSDLENAADLSGNSRLAYNTSRKKMDLIYKCRIK